MSVPLFTVFIFYIMLKYEVQKSKYKNMIENVTVCTTISLCCVRFSKCSSFVHRRERTERKSDSDQRRRNVKALAKNLQ